MWWLDEGLKCSSREARADHVQARRPAITSVDHLRSSSLSTFGQRFLFHPSFIHACVCVSGRTSTSAARDATRVCSIFDESRSKQHTAARLTGIVGIDTEMAEQAGRWMLYRPPLPKIYTPSSCSCQVRQRRVRHARCMQRKQLITAKHNHTYADELCDSASAACA